MNSSMSLRDGVNPARRACAAALLLVAGSALTALSPNACAQADDAYPTKPIHWIVPYLPGTSPDNTVRVVAEAMSEQLRQPVVVENKPGAAGNLGARLAAKAAADGYTLVYSGSPMASSMRMYKKPGFDALKDFIHIGRIGTSELTVVVSPDSGITSLRDLIDRMRKAPGKLTYASGGVGSPAHLGAELMLSTAGVSALHVPHKGATESVSAVIGRQVDFALVITSVGLPQVQAGKLLPVGVTSGQRHPRLANTPTLRESGVAVTLVSVGGLSVPAGTPAPIVRRVSDALATALARPEVRAKIEALGGNVVPSSADEYLAVLQAEIALTEKMMAVAKLEAQ